jgi:radical SAM protein with 4Fe4S-binding SPASM domain
MMVKDWLKRLFTFERPSPPPPIEPGLYHAMKEAEGIYTRFHLRVEGDSSGMLIANATAAAQLTPTGVVIVKGLLEGMSNAEILDSLQQRFSGATETMMREDIDRIQSLIQQIVQPGDAYPVFNLEDASISPRSAQLIAPMQAAVPLAEPDRLVPIIDRLWAVGIPHATFWVPRSPDAAALVRAVERAEDLGMIAGVRGRATDLAEGSLLQDLWQAGLDHVTLIYASDDVEVHDALCGDGDQAAALAMLDWLEEEQVSAVAEIPLVHQTMDTLFETIETLLARGADNLSFVAFASADPEVADDRGVFNADAMVQVATTVEETADRTRARFMWNPPVEVDPALSLADQVRAGPRCSGDVAVRVEPDGTVIPPRGPAASAGNLLSDAWADIWNHDVFRIYRERVEAPTRCDVCPGLTICAAACPREPEGWARLSASEPETT